MVTFTVQELHMTINRSLELEYNMWADEVLLDGSVLPSESLICQCGIEDMTTVQVTLKEYDCYEDDGRDDLGGRCNKCMGERAPQVAAQRLAWEMENRRLW